MWSPYFVRSAAKPTGSSLYLGSVILKTTSEPQARATRSSGPIADGLWSSTSNSAEIISSGFRVTETGSRPTSERRRDVGAGARRAYLRLRAPSILRLGTMIAPLAILFLLAVTPGAPGVPSVGDLYRPIDLDSARS